MDALHYAQQASLPETQASPAGGMILGMPQRPLGPANVIERRALAGYPAKRIVRECPLTGERLTIERDPRHARVAHRALARAGLADPGPRSSREPPTSCWPRRETEWC